MITPTLKVERRLWRDGMTRVVGVDEVGVAPTCGAVVAAAVVMAPNCRRIAGVRDSKTLSAAQRERLAPIVRRRAIAFGVGAASVGEIDRLNIYHATHLAMRRAVARVGVHDHVLVDGLRIARFEEEVGPYTAIVDGDAHVYSIACASILAKVVRDRMMARLAARHPGYGWERNQGYATREHRDAIRRLGLTPFHRRSFLALQRTLAGDQATLGLFAADDALEVLDAVDLAAAVELGHAGELSGPADDADDGGHPGAEHDRPDVSKPGVLAPSVHGVGGIDVLATPVDLVIADLRPPEIATEA